MGDYKAQIISGSYADIIVRQATDAKLELGELLVAEDQDEKVILQVHDLFYGSQVSQQNLERISGFSLEGKEVRFINNEARNYSLARAKNILRVRKKSARSDKSLPKFFSKLRSIEKEDLSFLSETKNKLLMGNLRSGTKTLELPVFLDGEKVLSHHVLITGTTGRGKSVLMKNLIWEATGTDYASMLVFDPHDEYYGRKSFGLKDHPSKMVRYYTSKNVPSGERTLVLSLKLLRPDHFDFLDLTPPQRQLTYFHYKRYGDNWIERLVAGKEDFGAEFNEMTLAVTRRKLKMLLGIDKGEAGLVTSSIFSKTGGEGTVQDIVSFLEDGGTVIIDTSAFSGNTELLVASIITSEAFNKYKYYNHKGTLEGKPVINTVLEEAPRVIGKEALEQGPNVFSSIAREGRKFKVGLSAITQMPSLIPKEVLANMNTKIILGTEMNTERQAIIESASQDLSDDSRAIASLDKGEAIISTNFARFALPVSIPFFNEEKKKEPKKEIKSYPGLKE